ncbi:hypothetical protein BDD12DRAFT_839770 [Trichophaea hybrida]|nr:hypothetical protein BDD12DRAFT_839770 [Trichophaea hybrida]
MVTGVEITGIALAIFPIVLNGLTALHEFAGKIKYLKDYKKVLRRLVRDVIIEKHKFENTCEILLEGIVSAPDIDTLISGMGWDNPVFQEKLETRLRPKAAGIFVKTVDALNSGLQELKDQLALDQQHEPALLDKHTRKRQWKKIRLLLQKDEHSALLEEICKRNADLVYVLQTPTSSTRTSISSTRKPVAPKTYVRVRNHATNLYAIFRQSFQAVPPCSCSTPHNASLVLQRVMTDEIAPIKFRIFFSFGVGSAVGQAPWKWSEMEFEPADAQEETESNEEMGSQKSDEEDFKGKGKAIEGKRKARFTAALDFIFKKPDEQHHRFSLRKALRYNVAVPAAVGGAISARKDGSARTRKTKIVAFDVPPESARRVSNPPPLPNSLRQIANLCSEIRWTRGAGSSCVGILLGDNGWWHRVWLPATPSACSEYLAETVSLDSLLQSKELALRDRLKLGVVLCSAVMQLHSTEWLGESWGKQDIFFPQTGVTARTVEGEIVVISKPVLDNPLVRRTFGATNRPSSAQQTAPTSRSPLVHYDKSLFSLGIVLVELWYGKRLEDLQSSHQANQLHDHLDYYTANQRIEEIETKAGPMYGAAIRRCIRGLDCTTQSLENERFKEQVQEQVMSQLELNWSRYDDGYCSRSI